MLGSRTEISLLLILIIPTLIVPVFAESLILETDKAEYEIGDSMVISGVIGEKKMPVVALKIFDPNGSILSANQVDIQDDNTFSKTISIDSPFYDEVGTYSITIDYGKLEAQTDFKIVNDDVVETIIEDDFEFFFPEILAMFTDQEVYEDGDIVTIIGLVSEKDQDSVLIGIYDPFGTPAGFYFGDVDSDFEFAVSFLVKAGVNFKTEGTYSISAFYGDSEEYTTFEYVEKIESVEPADDTPIDTEDETSQPEQQVEEKKPVTQKETPVTIPDKKVVTTTEKKSTKPKSENNLSVEDIELGIMLNQINLSCDNNEYVDTITYYDSMGPALIRLCKYADAIYYYDQSLASDPNNVDILNNKGSALAKMKFYDEAIIHYDSVLALKPNNFQALNNKANALANLEKFDEAIPTYNRALVSAPGNPIILNNLDKAQSKLTFVTQDEIIPIQEPPVLEQEQNLVKSNNQETTNIFSQIENMFSSLFGFLSE